MIQSLDVMLWENKVGTLVSSKKGYSQQIYFYFDPDFVKSGLDIAPIRASIHGVVAQSGLPVFPEAEKHFGGLPSFVADSLPDAWGIRLFNEWAKARKIRKKDMSVLDKLAYIGRRGMGALEFIPPAAAYMETPFKVEIESLSELARMAMTAAQEFHISLTPGMEIESLFKVGTSAGGRRPKAVINFNPNTGECYSGQVAAPAEGFTPMIIKFDEHSTVPTTRIEYSYYLMASAVGMEMMPSRLWECRDGVHFLTDRFDRVERSKLHVQTLAAMNPLATSYEEWFEVAQQLRLLPNEKDHMFLHMVMNVLAGNVDDHNKNFSFVMNPDGIWRLAPAYDFTFAVDPSAPHYINRHCMTIGGKNGEIERADLLEMAKRFDIKNAGSMIRRAAETVRCYRQFGQQAGVPENWIRAIEQEISDCLCTLGDRAV